jgi:hypothetical protein
MIEHIPWKASKNDIYILDWRREWFTLNTKVQCRVWVQNPLLSKNSPLQGITDILSMNMTALVLPLEQF